MFAGLCAEGGESTATYSTFAMLAILSNWIERLLRFVYGQQQPQPQLQQQQQRTNTISRALKRLYGGF